MPKASSFQFFRVQKNITFFRISPLILLSSKAGNSHDLGNSSDALGTVQELLSTMRFKSLLRNSYSCSNTSHLHPVDIYLAKSSLVNDRIRKKSAQRRFSKHLLSRLSYEGFWITRVYVNLIYLLREPSLIYE